MLELPGTPWREAPWAEAEFLGWAPAQADWRAATSVRHLFTHFELRLAVRAARVDRITAPGLVLGRDALAAEALPTLARKCLAAATKAIDTAQPNAAAQSTLAVR
jgi:A/G-specific adenine glycosylase